MARTAVTSDAHVEHVHPVTDAGKVTGLVATVNYALGETRVREDIDVWASLTATQKTNAQALYVSVVAAVKAEFE